MSHLVQRMVERRNRSNQAKWLAHGEDFSRLTILGGVTRENILIIAQRLGGGELEHLLRASNLVTCLAHAQTGLEPD